jgi:autotransporter-associated beta strand protein
MNKRYPSARCLLTVLKILVAACLMTSQAAAESYYNDGLDGSRIDRAANYSHTDGSMDDATVNPGASDDLIFYNSTVGGSLNLTLRTGPHPLTFNSMTFRSYEGTTQIERSAAVEDATATVVSIGAGGITLEPGAGAVTFGRSADSGFEQRVVVGAVADLAIANNSDHDLTFGRQVDGRSTNTMHTITVTGTGSGNVVFAEGVRANDAGRDLALTVNTSGTGVVRLEGTNNYTGPTTVAAGKLFINAEGHDAIGLVSVAGGATLGGSGTLGGDATIAENGRLEFDIGTSPGSHQPMLLASLRSLTFSGSSVLTITSQGGASVGKYRLLTAPGGIVGTAPDTLSLPEGWAGSVSIAGNELVLDLTSVGTP